MTEQPIFDVKKGKAGYDKYIPKLNKLESKTCDEKIKKLPFKKN